MRNALGYLGAFASIVFGIIGTLLGLRFILRLFNANSANDLVSWLYDTSRPLIEPFENIFPTVRLEDGFVLEMSTLLALLVYGLLASLIFYGLDSLAVASTPKKRRKK